MALSVPSFFKTGLFVHSNRPLGQHLLFAAVIPAKAGNQCLFLNSSYENHSPNSQTLRPPGNAGGLFKVIKEEGGGEGKSTLAAVGQAKEVFNPFQYLLVTLGAIAV